MNANSLFLVFLELCDILPAYYEFFCDSKKTWKETQVPTGEVQTSLSWKAFFAHEVVENFFVSRQIK